MAPRKAVKKPIVKVNEQTNASSKPPSKRQKRNSVTQSNVNDVIGKSENGESDKAVINEAMTSGDKISDINTISEIADKDLKPDLVDVKGKQPKNSKKGKRQEVVEQIVEEDDNGASEAGPNLLKVQQKRKKKVNTAVDSDEDDGGSRAGRISKASSKRPRRGKMENDETLKPETRSSDSEEDTVEDSKLDNNLVKNSDKQSIIPEDKVGRKRKVKDEAEPGAVTSKKEDDGKLSTDSDFEKTPKKLKAERKPKRATKVAKAEGKSVASKSAKTKIVPKKEGIPDLNSLDFSNNALSTVGKQWNLKITSWNVNGIRAWLQKDGLDYLSRENPDIMCIQETKCADAKLPDEIKNLDGYHCFWLSGDKDGYSGVGLLSKNEPIDIKYGINMKKHDNEGRVITAEFEQFYLVTSYVPNAGKGLVRLDYRKEFDADFRSYLKKLDEDKPVILCGDLNVAHEEIDLKNPKTNKKNAGFTQEERDGFTSLLSEGFVDSFRELYPNEEHAYTFWTYMMNARAKNVGWRLDYFVISKKLLSQLCDNVIRKDVHGSDHCPITLFLAL